MTLICLALVALGVLAGCVTGYRWGVEDTERRWADAVARKADADAQAQRT